MFYHPKNYLRNQADTKSNMWGNAARLFVHNFDARLAGIAILADRPCFEKHIPGGNHIAYNDGLLECVLMYPSNIL